MPVWRPLAGLIRSLSTRWGVTRHSRAARGSHPQTGYRVSPDQGWRSIGMVADQLDFVVGVDPHRDEHALGVVEVRSGVVVFETSVAADSGGYANALAVAQEHAPGRRAFAVEGTGSYGAGLTRFLAGRGEQVFEVGRLPRQRRGVGRQTRSTLSERPARCSLSSGPQRPAPLVSGRRCGR